MRHQHKGFKLGRTHAHREATLAALSSALIAHKRIRTTTTKAKALRMYVEPLITRSKTDTTHNRREVFRHLQSKEAVKELFGDVATKVGDRAGGYTRIVKLGPRPGDGAEMAIIELVDYNDVQPDGIGSRRTRRTRRGGGRSRRGGAKTQAQQQAQQTEAPADAEAPEEPNEAAEPTEDVTAAPAEATPEASTDVPEEGDQPGEEPKAE